MITAKPHPPFIPSVLRSLAILLLLYNSTCPLLAQTRLPDWMYEALHEPVPPGKPTTSAAADTTSNGFIGSYSAEGRTIGKVEELTGWADASRSIIQITDGGRAEFTSLLDRRVGIHVVIAPDDEGTPYTRIMSTGHVEEPYEGETNAPQAAKTGGQRKLLDRTCAAYMLPRSGSDTVHFWTEEMVPSPFADLPPLKPFMRFIGHRFTEFCQIDASFPMRWEIRRRAELRSEVEVTRLKLGSSPLPELKKPEMGMIVDEITDPAAAERLRTMTAPLVLPTEEAPIFTQVDQMPQFPGGEEALLRYLVNTVQYPEVEAKAGIQGKVYVQFTVGKEGSISDVKVMRGVQHGPGLDREAVRAIQAMPKWTPGRTNGRPVSVRYTLPVIFQLP